MFFRWLFCCCCFWLPRQRSCTGALRRGEGPVLPPAAAPGRGRALTGESRHQRRAQPLLGRQQLHGGPRRPGQGVAEPGEDVPPAHQLRGGQRDKEPVSAPRRDQGGGLGGPPRGPALPGWRCPPRRRRRPGSPQRRRGRAAGGAAGPSAAHARRRAPRSPPPASPAPSCACAGPPQPRGRGGGSSCSLRAHVTLCAAAPGKRLRADTPRRGGPRAGPRPLTSGGGGGAARSSALASSLPLKAIGPGAATGPGQAAAMVSGAGRRFLLLGARRVALGRRDAALPCPA